MKIFELFDDSSEYDERRSYGLFASEEAVRAHIVHRAMTGQGLKSVEIVEQEIQGEPAQRGGLDGDAVAALRVSRGPWYAAAHNIELGDGTSLEVSTAHGASSDDARIALVLVQLVNEAMAGKWNA